MDELQAWAASLPPHEEIAQMDKTDTSTALLPCPFCGGEKLDGGYNEYGGLVTVCANCDAHGPASEDDISQIKTAWNRRALVPALSAENAELRAKLDAAADALRFGVDLIEGDSFGLEWKRGQAVFRRKARATIAKIKGADHE